MSKSWAVGSGQWAVGSGRLSPVNGHWSVDIKPTPPPPRTPAPLHPCTPAPLLPRSPAPPLPHPPAPPPPRSPAPLPLTSAFILTIYTLLTLILTYPLIFNLSTAVPNDIGDPLLNTWILAWDAHALLTGPLNLFNANIFYPLPNTLAYSEHLFSTALLALPIQLITGEPVAAYNLSLLATFPLAAFGMYLLALRWTGQRSAAFIGGLVFGFAPYRFAAIAHLQLLTFQWLPFALLFLDLALRKKPIINYQLPITNYQLLITDRRLLALCLFLLLQILASWYLAIYTALIIGVYLIFAVLAQRLTRIAFAKLAVTFLFTGLLILPFVWPYLTLIDNLREARPLSLALSLAAAPTDFAAAAPFNTIFGPLTESLRARPGFTEENMMFTGIIAPLLALIALPALMRNYLPPRTALLPASFYKSRANFPIPLSSFLILLIAIILTFPTPYAVLTNLIPPTTIIRVPPRWIIPALFALADLTAFGYAIINKQLHKNYKSSSSFIIHRSSLIILTAFLLTESLSLPLPLAPVENRTTLSPVYHWLAKQPDNFALIELPLHSAPAPEYPEVKRLYASSLGWWPIKNGYSGYTPPFQSILAQSIAPFPYEQSIPTLQILTINLQSNNPKSKIQNPKSLYLLIHPNERPFDRTQWETIDRWRAERNPALLPLGQFEGDYLYQILPPVPRPSTPLAIFGPKKNIQLLTANTSWIQHTNPQSKIQNPKSKIITLHWQPTALLSTDYTVFIHLRAADGFVRNQADGPPVSGRYATVNWQPNEVIQDIHLLPDEEFTQVDHLAIGLYNPATGERLPAFGPAGERLADDAVIVSLQK